MCLGSASTDCKQRSSTVSKKSPTVSKETSPHFEKDGKTHKLGAHIFRTKSKVSILSPGASHAELKGACAYETPLIQSGCIDATRDGSLSLRNKRAPRGPRAPKTLKLVKDRSKVGFGH